jgi:hypothetical protein
MKTVGLLIFCSISLLQPGARDRPSGPAHAPRPAVHASSAETRRPADRLPPGSTGGEGLGALLWDGEDGSDADCLDTGLYLTSPCFADRAAIALFALSQGSAVWTSCHRIPLRC